MQSSSAGPDPALPGDTPWRVAITGSSGLIGSALVDSLKRDRHQVIRLVRSREQAGGGNVFWDPARGELDAAALEGMDAVVHLAGENIAGIWTEAKKRRIRDSRVEGGRLVAEAIARLERPPRVYVSSGGVNFYGDDRGDEILDETSATGTGFLAQVAREWEAAAEPAARAGVRVVNLRFGVVLSRRGGMLQVMLLPFKLGVGGKLGSGRQWLSWIALEDAVGVIRFGMATETLRGPVNAMDPNPVRNEEFTRTLGRVLGRPTLLPVPEFALRLAPGEMGENTVLASQRAVPKRLLDAGYRFRYPHLEDALRAALEHE
jgi:uncharacterized protein (TIGR01777 family)